MVMALSVSDPGCVYHVKRPGAVLNAGDIIAKLDLDDPSKVTKAKLFEGNFSPSKAPLPKGDLKLTSVYSSARQTLDNILNGIIN